MATPRVVVPLRHRLLIIYQATIGAALTFKASSLEFIEAVEYREAGPTCCSPLQSGVVEREKTVVARGMPW